MSYKFLVVDDEADLVEFMEAMLLEDFPGSEIHGLTDPSEAVDYCRANVYDIIYTNFMMPQMAGDEFIKSVRDLGNDNQTTGVIVLTGNSEPPTLATENLKNTFVLEKPIDRELNKQKVRILLSMKT